MTIMIIQINMADVEIAERPRSRPFYARDVGSMRLTKGVLSWPRKPVISEARLDSSNAKTSEVRQNYYRPVRTKPSRG